MTRKYAHRRIEDVFQQVKAWFVPENVDEIFGPAHTQTDILARQWLLQGGNRFRPFLLTALTHAFGNASFKSDRFLQQIAFSVECFHKAALIHDDIEDGDALRYGHPTQHTQWGVPIALNIGDLLVGEGYRLLSDIEVSADRKERLFQIASSRHVTLCRGQGEELLYEKNRKDLTFPQLIEFVRNKTAPAFEVALLFGLVYSDTEEKFYDRIQSYGQTLGIAYQILDDLIDRDESSDGQQCCFSIIKAYRDHEGLDEVSARAKAEHLYDQYRDEAVCIVRSVENSIFQELFHEITLTILRDVKRL